MNKKYTDLSFEDLEEIKRSKGVRFQNSDADLMLEFINLVQKGKATVELDGKELVFRSVK